jgi:subtilase family serine protease
MHTRARVLSLALAILLLSAFTTCAAASRGKASGAPAMVRLPGHVLSTQQEARVFESTPNSGGQAITLTLTLKRDHQTAFERYLHELYDSHSPKYRHFLTQRETAARFSRSRKSYDAVISYLERHGFKLVQSSKNRMTMTVHATRAEAEHITVRGI